MLRLKLDENMPDAAALILRSSGHDVQLARDENLAGAPDDDVLAATSTEGRVLVTLDVDFADVVRHPPGSTPGIVVLRPHRQSLDLVDRIVTVVGSLLEKETVLGRLWVIDESRLRVWPGIGPE